MSLRSGKIDSVRLRFNTLPELSPACADLGVWNSEQIVKAFTDCVRTVSNPEVDPLASAQSGEEHIKHSSN
jgi:hypothetical protein